jgi:hypothetical protein
MTQAEINVWEIENKWTKVEFDYTKEGYKIITYEMKDKSTVTFELKL